jgi:5,10-methylenetetrahydrofolate reductase
MVWKDIPKEFIDNNVNNYKISDYGRIKNKHGIRTGIIHGYLRVMISQNAYSLHRLVAKIFIPTQIIKKR